MAASNAWGRIEDDGTVYLVSPTGERPIGSWFAGSQEDGLAHFSRKYELLAAEVGTLEDKVRTGIGDPTSILASAQRILDSLPEANVLGDIMALANRCDVVSEKAAAKAEEFLAGKAAEKAARAEAEAAAKAAKEAEYAASVARKEQLAIEAESLAQSTEWKLTGDRLRAIVEEWKTIRIERKIDQALWARLSAARSEFDKRRGSHFATLTEARKTAASAKEKLISAAEELSTSTDWQPTANKFRDLMAEWKTTPRAARNIEDALWARFKAAQDVFFTARTSALTERDSSYAENQAAKEALLVEAEKLAPEDNLEAAQAAFRSIQERWAAAGKVPREVIRTLDARLDAVSSRIASVSERKWSQVSAASSPMVIRLKESIEKIEKRIARAQQAGDTKALAELEAQLTTQKQWLAQAD